MTPNPVLRALGLPPDARAVLIHTDGQLATESDVGWTV